MFQMGRYTTNQIITAWTSGIHLFLGLSLRFSIAWLIFHAPPCCFCPLLVCWFSKHTDVKGAFKNPQTNFPRKQKEVHMGSHILIYTHHILIIDSSFDFQTYTFHTLIIFLFSKIHLEFSHIFIWTFRERPRSLASADAVEPVDFPPPVAPVSTEPQEPLETESPRFLQARVGEPSNGCHGMPWPWPWLCGEAGMKLKWSLTMDL